jgi:hypothetical protein
VAAKKSRRVRDKASAGTTLPLALEMTDDAPVFYVNHAEITHTQHDFSIAWARVAAKLPTAKRAEAIEAGRVLVEPSVVLVVPPTMIQGLIDALQRQQTSYETTITKPKREATNGSGKK